MEIKEKITPKIVIILFNLLTIGFFVFAYFYPEQSGFRLAQEGVWILIVEFLSVGVISAQRIALKENITVTVFTILVPFFLLFMISFLILKSLIPFIYYIITFALKIYKTKKTEEVYLGEELGKKLVSIILSGIFSAIIFGGHSGGDIGEKPLFILFWGILYFSFISIFEFISFKKKLLSYL